MVAEVEVMVRSVMVAEVEVMVRSVMVAEVADRRPTVALVERSLHRFRTPGN